jgi:hypothetical protein
VFEWGTPSSTAALTSRSGTSSAVAQYYPPPPAPYRWDLKWIRMNVNWFIVYFEMRDEVQIYLIQDNRNMICYVRTELRMCYCILHNLTDRIWSVNDWWK